MTVDMVLRIACLDSDYNCTKPAAGAMQGARHIMASEGVRGLYQGLLPTLLRDVPEIAIQFALYEK